MPNQIEQSRTSNALGVPIPQWIIRQLDKRSEQLSVENQNSTTPNENLLFRANRSAWIRMVSSVDLIDPFIFFYNPLDQEDQYIKLGENRAKTYFQNLGIDIKNGSDLAKKFVLQGGVSTYTNENNNFSYNLREGFPDAYNVAGNQEVENYGYRPMPGITSVRVQTQGKLGSIRAAEIQLKVWDKAQLDIIDALYFKLGYTMFLEWGHTNYYKENGEFGSTEGYSLDPFEAGLTKEDIYNKVSNNIRESEGNYDAMLGMVTNFNFTYNQEGGYDCTIKLISLGVLISNMKMNNPRVLPGLQESVIRRLVNTLTELEKQNLAKAKQAADAESKDITNTIAYPPCIRDKEPSSTKDNGPTAFFAYGIKKTVNNIGYIFYADGRYQTTGLNGNGKYECKNGVLYIDGKNTTTSKESITSDEYIKKIIAENNNNNRKSFVYFPSDKPTTKAPNYEGSNVFTQFLLESKNPTYKNGYFIRKLSALLPDESTKLNNQIKVKLNYTKFLGAYNNGSNNLFIDKSMWQAVSLINNEIYTWNEYESEKRSYRIETKFDTSNLKPTISNISVSKLNDSGNTINAKVPEAYSSNQSTSEKIITEITKTLANPSLLLNLKSIELPTVRISEIQPITIMIEGSTIVKLFVDVKLDNYTIANKLIKGETKNEAIDYIVPFTISFTDTDLIDGITSTKAISQPPGFKNYEIENVNTTAPVAEEPKPQETGPAISASDIQKTESEKYKSAFEVIIRTIQLYSLDNAITSNIETDHIVKKLSFIQKDSTNNQYNTTYKEFTKELFSTGLFADMLEDLDAMSRGGGDVEKRCKVYDEQMKTGTVNDKEEMLRIRALFGFHFGLLANVSTAQRLLKGNLAVNFSALMSTYTVPYEFNQGIVQGTQLNHPVYMPLGFVIMILNHMCTIYDNNKPVVYLDFNHKSNLCLSNAKHLSTNPYEILIPFQGTDQDFLSILEPTTIEYGKKQGESDNAKRFVIMPTSGSDIRTNVYTPRNPDTSEQAMRDRISGDLLPFKPNEIENEIYRGRTMNILISCDYLLRSVGTFTKSNGSGDVYVREFIEQILSDINKSLGDINVFRLAYDDSGNAIHIVDDQITQNLENDYPRANESFRNVSNRSKLPLFGKGSIAKTLEIRTEISSKLSNMIAVSANANIDDQANLSKSTDSFGFYNTSYKDRYIPKRTEYTSNIALPTDTMIRSTIQFNEAIKTFYGDAKPAEGSVGHATNYYIQRMSKIKSSEKGTRASAMIPVSLNFSMDGMSGFGMGQSFTIDNEFLPYTYNLSLTDPYGEQDRDRTVAFVMTGLDHTIEGNQWTSNVRTNMIYSKKQTDFNAEKIKTLDAASGLRFSESTSTFTGVSIAAKKLNYTAEQIKNAVKKKGYTWYESDYKLNIVGVRNSSTKNLVTNKFDDIITVTYKEGSEIKFYQWAITTDPGAYYVKNFFPGTTSTGRMVQGQYINAYSIGIHRSKYEALVEVGPIKAFRDADKNEVYNEDNIQQGNFSMNIHKASESENGVATEIKDTSAGCQVFSSTQDFNNFMILVRSSRTKLNSNSFTYTLLLSEDII